MQNQTLNLILSFDVYDPVGAIGVQADITTFASFGCHGLSVITALIIGDTTGIQEIQALDPDWIADQARTLLEDMPISAIKVGYIGSVEIASVIAEITADYPDLPLILDPFSRKLPDQNIDEDLILGIIELLLPQTKLFVISECQLFRLVETWGEYSKNQILEKNVECLITLGCEFVFVTGKIINSGNNLSNYLFCKKGLISQSNWLRQDDTFIGAGNTLTAGISAKLGMGFSVSEAIVEAEIFNNSTLMHAKRLGMGKKIPNRFFWIKKKNFKK